MSAAGDPIARARALAFVEGLTLSAPVKRLLTPGDTHRADIVAVLADALEISLAGRQTLGISPEDCEGAAAKILDRLLAYTVALAFDIEAGRA